MHAQQPQGLRSRPSTSSSQLNRYSYHPTSPSRFPLNHFKRAIHMNSRMEYNQPDPSPLTTRSAHFTSTGRRYWEEQKAHQDTFRADKSFSQTLGAAVTATPRDSASTFRSTRSLTLGTLSTATLKGGRLAELPFDAHAELQKKSIKQLLTPARSLVNLKRRMPTHEIVLRTEADKVKRALERAVESGNSEVAADLAVEWRIKMAQLNELSQGEEGLFAELAETHTELDRCRDAIGKAIKLVRQVQSESNFKRASKWASLSVDGMDGALSDLQEIKRQLSARAQARGGTVNDPAAEPSPDSLESMTNVFSKECEDLMVANGVAIEGLEAVIQLGQALEVLQKFKLSSLDA